MVDILISERSKGAVGFKMMCVFFFQFFDTFLVRTTEPKVSSLLIFQSKIII